MTSRRTISDGSDTSGRRGGGIVPAPPSSSSIDGPSRELPAHSLEEHTRAEAGRASSRDPRSRARGTASDAGGEDPLARPGPSSSARGGPGGQKGKRRRVTGPDSSPEGGPLGRELTRAEAREVLVREESYTPTTTRRRVDRALEVLDAVEGLRVRPTYREGEGVTVRQLLWNFGRGLSPVRRVVHDLGSAVEGTGDDDRVEELERVVRNLREEKSELQAEVDALRRDVERLRSDLLSTSASAGAGPREPPAGAACASNRRIRRELKADKRRDMARWREGRRAEERGGGPPPMHDVGEFPPLPPAADGWTLVTGRRARATGNARQRDAGNRAPAAATAGRSDRRAGAPVPPAPANRPRGNPGGAGPTRPKRSGAKRQDRRRAAPKTAAVTITAIGERSYADIMRAARETVDIEDIGVLDNMAVKRAINGGYKLEISGPDNSAKADRLARDLEAALGDVAKIARPAKLAEIRIVGLDDSATREEVVRATARVGECPQSALRTGEIRRAASGLGALWMRLPLDAANRLAAAGRIRVGWASAGVRLLEERPLQCYACLQFGHAAAACRADQRHRGRCFNCGGMGHEAQGCVNRSRCPLCLDAGRDSGHRMGGRACRAREHPTGRRGLPNTGRQPGRVGGGMMGTRAPDRHPAAPGRTAEQQAGGRRAQTTREARTGPTEGGTTATDREVMPPPPPPREARAASPDGEVDRVDLTTQEETQRSEGVYAQADTQATTGSRAGDVDDRATPDDMEWDDWGEQAR